MKTYKKSGSFKETKDFQDAYDSLLSACEREGSLILKQRVLEKDKDIFPYRFVRDGTMEYVFPQQETSLIKDNSEVIDPTEDYKLWSEMQEFSFDASRVTGRIRIEYKDADNTPELEVTDVLGESRLPKSMMKTLDDLFK